MARWKVPARGAAALAGIAGVLGFLGWWSARAVRRAEKRFPPVGQFIDHEGLRLHYVSAGTGRPVVFFHGIAGSTLDFAPVLDGASREFRVVAFDRPGHGYSQRPRAKTTLAAQARILHGALAQLGIEKPVVVGHSLGGALALEYALRYPEDISGLVLVSAAAYPLKGYTLAVAFAALMRSPILGDLLRATLAVPFGPRLVDATMARAFAPDTAPEAFVRQARALWTRPSQIRAISEDGLTLFPTTRANAPRYGAIRVPTTVLTGDSDRIVPADDSFRLHRAVPHSELITLSRTGHHVPLTRPEEVLQAIRDTWERVGKQAR